MFFLRIVLRGGFEAEAVGFVGGVKGKRESAIAKWSEYVDVV